MPDSSARLPRDILEDMEARIAAEPAEGGVVRFVKQGILDLVRAAIAAEAELEALGRPAP